MALAPPRCCTGGVTELDARRAEMLERHLARRGITDALVLDAMAAVPREEFVSPDLRADAYADHPLPIGDGQTISQPYIVALMVQAARVRAGSRVLEVGTGSGYAAAVLAAIAAEVWSIERMPLLAARAGELLARLGYDNAHVRQADGTLGLLEHAPYDAIIVSAAGPSIPDALRAQLAPAGRLVLPVESPSGWQRLLVLHRPGDAGPGAGRADAGWELESLGGVRFVPLIGEQGWQPNGTQPGSL
ncbi:protein-L-isoaspartate(D-aspartate) O-methyltransferase [Microterricola viridarii]|uniref:Protein-L-isoaspartate O-methyltransferase n=1 Tax=Microterricola viridarii TaxID=412690 RepID=A0A1H1RDK8_9MICO|nr:protein-L-isoaspartate(D-aspartate) O-methyltransferase [Microterricola viridarii]